jgi:hypothetical protein
MNMPSSAASSLSTSRHASARPPRPAWPLLLSAAALAWASAAAQAQVADTLRPIALHTAGTGDVAGMKKFIELSTLACRGHKGLPLDAPIRMPSDTTLAKLRLQEREVFFEGAQHAEYETQRMVAADPRTGDCAVRLFHYRTARAGQVCGNFHHGNTTLLGHLVNTTEPQPPEVRQRTQRDSQAGCGKPAKPQDITGLPDADAGAGQRCVWQLDIVAKTLRAAGMKAAGHSDDTAMDTCLYQRQPAYFHNGKRTPVIVRISGRPELDPMNTAHGGTTALLGQKLLSLTDGAPIPAGRFSAEGVRAFVGQAAITAVEE